MKIINLNQAAFTVNMGSLFVSKHHQFHNVMNAFLKNFISRIH
jgi:hypothetical protein